MKEFILFILVGLLAFSVNVSAETRDTLIVKADGDTLKMKKLLEKPHSPHKATVMAFVLPGSGQIYNRQWWKVPILYGGIAADIYGITWNQARYKEYRDAYREWTEYLEGLAVNPDLPYPKDPAWDKIPKNFDLRDEKYQTETFRNWFKTTLENRKTSFKRNRDLCYIVMAAIYAINVIDATVYAHFYDFEIDDDLSLHWQPTSSYNSFTGGTIGVTLTLNF